MKSLFLSCVLGLLASAAYAGGGHDHGEGQLSGQNATSSFTLEETSIRNLKIETVVADIKPVRESTRMLMQIKMLPEKQTVISPRFQGKVIKIHVKLGDRISRGQTLVTLQPISIGNPPVNLSSPVSGVLSQQLVTVGSAFDAGDTLMEVSDRNTVLAKGMTYESAALTDIRVGQDVTVRVDSLKGRIFSGTVQRIDPAIDENQRTVSVFAVLNNPGGVLIPHMQGQMDVFTGVGDPMLAVPTRAVLGTMGQHFVYVRDGNYFEKRNVTLGVLRGGQREIIDGVFPGENVVVQGNYQLQYVTPAGQPAHDAAGGDHGHAH